MNVRSASRMRPVQRSVVPAIGLCTDVPLYFRCNDRVTFAHRDPVWRLGTGGEVWFDTYFNGLSVKRWKETSPLDDLHVEIAFQGRLTARLHRMQVGPIATVLDELSLESPVPTVRRWRVADWDAFDDGIVYLSVLAHEASVVTGFSFVTSTPPARPVRLGICITHYDRRAQIVPAIARLKRELLDDPTMAASVGLVVVDNSRNLEAGETAGATVLPNRNLGGAGGFARGMMHLRDDGSYTHVLFMDDDASCEVESIRRTIALLAHARDPRTAISGAMLRTVEPYRQFERGASFNGTCRPERSGIDLRDRAMLAWNEREQNSDYGGWWFFAFSLAAAPGYPYPYFVRGDDVDFALRNALPIVHANGVASWQDDFATKHGPQTTYLDTRSHLAHLLHGFRGGRLRAAFVCARQFLLPNLAGQYELAAAALMAIEDVRRGPAFFRDHADMAEPRRRLQALMRDERMRPMAPEVLRGAVFTGLPEPRWRGWLRTATLNGHLIPTVFFHRRPVRFEKGFVLPLRGTFRRRRILIHDEFSGTGMQLVHSKRRFFTNLARFAVTAGGFVLGFERLGREYRAAYPTLTGDAFWREQFGLAPVRAGDATSTPASTPYRDAATTTAEPLAHAA